MLALEFGFINTDEMLDKISRQQFYEWMAYYQIQPFGDQRRDMRSAQIAASMGSGNPMDYMMFLEVEQDESAIEAMASLFQ